MKLHYYPDTDSLYIELSADPGSETREVSDGVNVDLDAQGKVVGFDIDRASRVVDLSSLEIRAPLVFAPAESRGAGATGSVSSESGTAAQGRRSLR